MLSTWLVLFKFKVDDPLDATAGKQHKLQLPHTAAGIYFVIVSVYLWCCFKVECTLSGPRRHMISLWRRNNAMTYSIGVS